MLVPRAIFLPPGCRRRGLTLIELVVVLVILAAVAALVIPNLGFIQGQAGNSTTAAASAQLVSNVETYKTSTGSYPLGLDSLVDTGGALYDRLWTHASPSFGPGVYFEVKSIGDLPAGSWTTSFGHAFGTNSAGERYVYDHDPAATDPSNSATAIRVLGALADEDFAFVRKSATPPLSVFLANFHRELGYSQGVPADVELLVMGIGPNSGLRETMASTPRHTEQSNDLYGRYFAVFAIHQSGKPARLKAVLDSQGVGVDGNIATYLSLAPEVE